MMDMLQSLIPFSEWHWLRPLWLLATVPAVVLTVALLRSPINVHARWTQVIDPVLLPDLLQGDKTPRRRLGIWAVFIMWILAALALAGPSWEQTETESLKRADAVVILLDLSPSMLVEDIKPSRLQAAHYKLLDLLKQRKEGYTALVAYAGSAHVVAPLSDDANTIAALVPTLEPGIMPLMGSQPEDAVTRALELLQNAHFPRGRLLLVTDGIEEAAINVINEKLTGQSVSLSVIGVGTTTGGSVPLAQGGYLGDASGRPRVFSLDALPLQSLAAAHGGQYSNLAYDDSDIAPLVALPDWLSTNNDDLSRNSNHSVSHWHDKGYWLIFPVLLLALFSFRRGLLITWLLPFIVLLQPMPVRALEWNDLWQTPDQQAQRKLQAGDPAAAAALFQDPQWKGYAEYQNNEHEKAAEHFAQSETAEALYNEGNALAQQAQLEQAIERYEQALSKKQGFDDAAFNLDLVKKLLEQQKKQQGQNEQGKQNQQDDQQQDSQQSQSSSQQKSDTAGQPGEGQSQDGQPQQDQDQQAASKEPTEDPLNKDPARQNSESENAPQDKQAQSGQPSPADSSEQAQANEKPESDKKAPPEKTEGNESENSGQAAGESGSPTEESPEEREKRQATEQWLRKVPDDPGGLLRNKFEYYYEVNRRNARQQQRSQTTENQRW
jgi:Ca-activated chloride channel family protein